MLMNRMKHTIRIYTRKRKKILLPLPQQKDITLLRTPPLGKQKNTNVPTVMNNGTICDIYILSLLLCNIYAKSYYKKEAEKSKNLPYP